MTPGEIATPARPLTIVHAITRFERAGAEENTALTINHQAQMGHRVLLVCGKGADKEMLATLDGGVEIVEIPDLVHPISPLCDLKALGALRQLFRTLTVDLVHTHQSKAGILGRLAAKWAGVPHVVHTTHILAFLNVGPLKRLIYWVLEKLTGFTTDAFIHVSPAMEQACLSAGIGHGKIHRVIYSGMDLAKFKTAQLPEDAAEILGGFESKPLVVLMLAAFEPRKRHQEFISVFGAVLRQQPNAVLLLAGTGSETPAVRAYIKNLNLTDKIKLLGYRDDPEALITLSDICMLASEREGLPRSVIQYVAGGRPVVATALPGLEILIQHGSNGFLVPVDDLQAMVPHFLGLMEDETARVEMGKRSADRNLEAWESQHMVAQINALVEELVALKT